MKERKIAVLFPGIGYTCDRSLLYFAGKLALNAGYEIMPVKYGNFPSGVKGNAEKMKQCFYSALEQTEEILAGIKWEEYAEILFVSKSVGTVVSACYMKEHRIRGRSVSFTPLENTFLFAEGDGIMFHGTADPWAPDDEAIALGCKNIGQKLYITENANHSLETGDVLFDIQNLRSVMEIVDNYINMHNAERI